MKVYFFIRTQLNYLIILENNFLIFRWRKFSHLEPSHTYLPSPEGGTESRLSSLVPGLASSSRNNSHVRSART